MMWELSLSDLAIMAGVVIWGAVLTEKVGGLLRRVENLERVEQERTTDEESGKEEA